MLFEAKNSVSSRHLTSSPPPRFLLRYVQHEVLANASESVITFMSRGLSTDTDTDTPADTAAVSAALSAVGFSEALQNAAVSELSGGWRMRMAIARSMLKKVDILVLDEARLWFNLRIERGFALLLRR